MDRETWHAAVYGVANSQTWLSDWIEHLIISLCNLLWPTVQLHVWKNLPCPAIIAWKYIRASEKMQKPRGWVWVRQNRWPTQASHFPCSNPAYFSPLPLSTGHILKGKTILKPKLFTYTSLTKLIVFWGNTGKETDKEKGKEAYKQNLYQTPNHFK